MIKIDKVSCLCVDKRKEFWTKLDSECAARGIHLHKFIAGDGTDKTISYDHIDIPTYPATWLFTGVNGWQSYNCFVCHQRMIQLALSEGVETILMMEDDAYFTSRFDDVMAKVSEELAWTQWDMLYLGYHNKFGTPQTEVAYNTSGYCSIGKCTDAIRGLWGVLIKRNVFPLILSLQARTPVDSELGTTIGHNNLRSFYVKPRAMHIRATYSNLEHTETELENI